ncbi:MAG: hypothetical protein ACREBU_21925 [Nitrososphaera sp.]
MVLHSLLFVWGCVPELTKDCQDMTNAAGTYLGAIIGAILAGIISWLIYNRQKHTSNKQDRTLEQIKHITVHQENTIEHIKKINEHQEGILKRIKDSDERLEKMLGTVMDLGKRTDLLMERQAGYFESFKSKLPQSGDHTETK